MILSVLLPQAKFTFRFRKLKSRMWGGGSLKPPTGPPPSANFDYGCWGSEYTKYFYPIKHKVLLTEVSAADTEQMKLIIRQHKES